MLLAGLAGMAGAQVATNAVTPAATTLLDALDRKRAGDTTNAVAIAKKYAAARPADRYVVQQFAQCHIDCAPVAAFEVSVWSVLLAGAVVVSVVAAVVAEVLLALRRDSSSARYWLAPDPGEDPTLLIDICGLQMKARKIPRPGRVWQM